MYLTHNISYAQFVQWCKHKKTLFKQRERDTLWHLKTWAECIKSSAIQISLRATAANLWWLVLSPFNWNYLSTHFVSCDGAEKHLEKCGSIQLTKHHCDIPRNKSKMTSTSHEAEMDIHTALPICFIKILKKTSPLKDYTKMLRLLVIYVPFINLDLEERLRCFLFPGKWRVNHGNINCILQLRNV